MNIYQKKINETSLVIESVCWSKLQDMGYYNEYDYSENGLIRECRIEIRRILKENTLDFLNTILTDYKYIDSISDKIIKRFLNKIYK